MDSSERSHGELVGSFGDGDTVECFLVPTSSRAAVFRAEMSKSKTASSVRLQLEN